MTIAASTDAHSWSEPCHPVRPARAAVDVPGPRGRQAARLTALRFPGPAMAAATPSASATNLPTPLAPLVGREREVAALCALLRRDNARLLILTGPDGVGKARLAQEAPQLVVDAFLDGMALVGLVPGRQPGSRPLRHRPGGGRAGGRRPAADRAAWGVPTDRQVLLVVDNVEGVTVAAPVVARLLGVRPSHRPGQAPDAAACGWGAA